MSMSEQKKRAFKRANKNRPMEISSKITTSRHRDVIQIKKKIHRDPRFDDLSGQYDENLFKRSYDFLDDVRSREKQKLEKMKKDTDPEKKQQMEYLINRMTQQEKAEKEKQKRSQIAKTVKQQETEDVKHGKKAFFLKKSDMKTLELAEKFRELKKSGKVERYMSKKRKKNSAKDRKRLQQHSLI